MIISQAEIENPTDPNRFQECTYENEHNNNTWNLWYQVVIFYVAIKAITKKAYTKQQLRCDPTCPFRVPADRNIAHRIYQIPIGDLSFREIPDLYDLNELLIAHVSWAGSVPRSSFS